MNTGARWRKRRARDKEEEEMIEHTPIRSREDLAARQAAMERAALDVIGVLKKHGAQLGDVENIFQCVRTVLGDRPV